MSQTVPAPQPLVFLFDVDNTLIDNDRVACDLRRHLAHEVGEERATEYFAIFEELRSELGYADYLGALQSYRVRHPHDPHLLDVSGFLINYPFANRLFPGALDAMEHAGRMGVPVIFSDGDVVFQPRKVERAGLREAAQGRVLIYIHKEHELEDVERRYPACHYVLVDDKMRIIAAVKRGWGNRVTTVFVRQGHYALASDVAAYEPADISLDRIGDFTELDSDSFDAQRTSMR